MSITDFNWIAIYTTNFDLLVERAYEQKEISYKTILSSADYATQISDMKGTILLYKPHGCINRLRSLVITEDDYYYSQDQRKAIYRLLELLKYRYSFLFIGYSFSDFNLSEIWQEVHKEAGEFYQWSYALWRHCTEEQKEYWKRKKVVLLDISFADFMKELKYLQNQSHTEIEEKFDEDNEAILAFFAALGAKSLYLKQHSLNVQSLCLIIAKEVGLSVNEIKIINKAALLHDIGFLRVPDSITEKLGVLNEFEYNIIRRHVIEGEQFVSLIPSIKDLAKIILYHHESYDGKGYPGELKGEEIPLASRIIAVADAYDAMISDRSYRKALTSEASIKEINRYSGIKFDPDIVNTLNKVFRMNK